MIVIPKVGRETFQEAIYRMFDFSETERIFRCPDWRIEESTRNTRIIKFWLRGESRAMKVTLLGDGYEVKYYLSLYDLHMDGPHSHLDRKIPASVRTDQSRMMGKTDSQFMSIKYRGLSNAQFPQVQTMNSVLRAFKNRNTL